MWKFTSCCDLACLQPPKTTRVTRAGEIRAMWCDVLCKRSLGSLSIAPASLQCSRATTRSIYDVSLISRGNAANTRVRPDRRMVMQAPFRTGSTTPQPCKRCGMVRREVTGCGVVDRNTPLQVDCMTSQLLPQQRPELEQGPVPDVQDLAGQGHVDLC